MVRNWGKEEGGTFPVFAQDHGAGKTFIVRHLAAFLGRPLGEDDVPIQLTDSTSKLALASTTLEFVVTAKKPTLTTLDFVKGDIRPFSHSLPHLHRLDQLAHVRTIEISWSDLTSESVPRQVLERCYSGRRSMWGTSPCMKSCRALVW